MYVILCMLPAPLNSVEMFVILSLFILYTLTT